MGELSTPSKNVEKDYLWLNLKDLPYFRALVRAIEARFYSDIDLPAPTLDLGCGDGHFSSVAFERCVEVGVDSSFRALREASRQRVYRMLVQGNGGLLPFPNSYFASVISNSVLEHIPDIGTVLRETARILRQGGRFVFCVPNQNFLPSLSVSRHFEKMGLKRLATFYRNFFNRISRHYHCDVPELWQQRLIDVGFRVEQFWNYFSTDALACMEWGHYFGVPSLISHWLFGQWILAHTRWNLSITKRIVERFYRLNAINSEGVYTFYIASKAF